MSGDLRTVARALRDAPAARVREAVAMIDALAERGAADALIAPLRGRLRQLGIPRRLGFVRLLFLPLDPVIRDPAGWRAEQAAVPRSALAPLGAAVQAALSEQAGAIRAAIAAGVPGPDLVDRFGPPLWTAGAEVLRALPAAAAPPPGWEGTGLPEVCLAPIATACACVLGAETALRAAIDRPDGPAVMARVLAATAAAGPDCLALLTAVLLGRCAAPAGLLALLARAAATAGRAAHAAVDRALTAVFERLEREAGAGLSATAADQAAGLLAAVANGTSPRQQALAQATQLRLDAACRARLETELAAQVLAPLRDLSGEAGPGEAGPGAGPGEAGAAAVAGIEHSARALAGYAAAARQLGNADRYDRLLRDAAAAVRAPAGAPALTPIDRVRMVEILAGPEAALALLEGREPGAAIAPPPRASAGNPG